VSSSRRILAPKKSEEKRMKIEGLDHLVLTVRSIEETCSFYENLLGMKAVIFGGGRRALAFAIRRSICIS
jgi:catechol-2,3-dioxygenase